MKDEAKKKVNKPIYFIETFVILAALWFVMSGIFETKFIVYGLGSAAIISFICVRTLQIDGLRTGNTYFLLHFNYWRMLLYFFWLMWQIILSAWYVSKVIVKHEEEVQPGVVWFKADYDNPVARSLLANSITLTPGTITIDIFDDGVYSVHGLTKEVMDGVLDGSMQNKIAAVFGETIDFRPLEVHEIPQGATMR